MITKTLSASDMLELHSKYSNYQFEEAADRGYSAENSRRHFDDYTKKVKQMGLTMQEAEAVRHYAVSNSDELLKVWNQHVAKLRDDQNVVVQFMVVS